MYDDSLRPHGLQHPRLPCPWPSPGVGSDSCLLSWWCYLTISSSAILFSFCLRSFPSIRVFSNESTLHIRCIYLFWWIIDLPWGMWTVSWGMRNLVPWPGITPGPPALGTWSLSHWTTRKSPLWGAWFISRLRQRFGESCVVIAGWTLLSFLSSLFYKQSNKRCLQHISKRTSFF